MNWESDTRPMHECLKSWHAAHRWTRNRAAHELRVSRSTYDGWCNKRGIALEQSIRRLMTLVDDAYPMPAAEEPADDTVYGDD